MAFRRKKLAEELAKRSVEKMAYKQKLLQLMKLSVAENETG